MLDKLFQNMHFKNERFEKTILKTIDKRLVKFENMCFLFLKPH